MHEGLDLDVRRAMLYDYWRWACGYPERRAVPESDARYRLVTEGRDTGPAYSSCADLAHAGHEYVGNRRPWLNRGASWQSGVNVWRIVEQCDTWAGKVAPGDVLVVANDAVRGSDAHVICVLQILNSRTDNNPPRTIYTAEYGQPGGALKSYRMADALGGRLIRWRLPFDVELRRAAAAGQLIDPMPRVT